MEKIFTKEEKEQVFDLYNNGIGIVTISKNVHTSPKKVKQILLEDYGIDVSDLNNKTNYGKVPFGYWNIKENCENAAKQCGSKTLFREKFLGACTSSIKNGWFEEFAEKYFTENLKHYKSYDSKIHLVYSYEFADNYVYVGRTTSLVRRDRTHRSKSENDTVYRHHEESGLPIPEVKILEKDLNALESQIEEDAWIKKYANDGWNIINKAKTGANIGSLGAIEAKWTYEACNEAASKCKNKEEFKKKFSRAHNVSRENNWIDEFFPFNSKKNNGCFNTLEGCKEACKGFKTILQIRKEYPFLYQKISKNKWIEEIRSFIGETKEDRKAFSYTKNNIKYLALNNSNLSGITYSELENMFFNMINCHVKAIIDDKSISNDKFYVRVDNKGIIFMLVNVRNNGSFKSLNQNSFLCKILDYCNSIGYRLVIVYDSELRYKTEIIKNKIEYLLGIKKGVCKTIGGRSCIVKEIDKSIASEFLNKYHIQGFASSTVYIGSYYGDELVGVMTFKNGSINISDWTLNRFATTDKYICCGIGGKMFNYFTRKYDVKKIITFGDRRWVTDNDCLYTKIGFVKGGITALTYYYFNTNDNDIPLLKNKTATSNKFHNKNGLTETEMAKELGYDRIWDCGLIRYIWERDNG